MLLHDISSSLEDGLNDLQKVQFTLKTGHEDKEWTSGIAQLFP